MNQSKSSWKSKESRESKLFLRFKRRISSSLLMDLKEPRCLSRKELQQAQIPKVKINTRSRGQEIWQLKAKASITPQPLTSITHRTFISTIPLIFSSQSTTLSWQHLQLGKRLPWLVPANSILWVSPFITQLDQCHKSEEQTVAETQPCLFSLYHLEVDKWFHRLWIPTVRQDNTKLIRAAMDQLLQHKTKEQIRLVRVEEQ